MKPHQTLWSALFLFGSSIYIGIKYGWLSGIIAFILNFIFGAILGQISIGMVPTKYTLTWAYIRDPLIAIILIICFHLYNK